jgi:hypothetical protein
MSDDSKPSTIEEALSPLQTSLIPRIARITEVSKQKTLSDDTGAQSTVAEAHENVCKAGAALAQQARAFHFLFSGGPPSVSDAEGVARDLEKAITMYDSWVGTLLTLALPAVRKAAGGPCCLVLQSLSALVSKAVQGKAQAPDVGKLQEAVDALTKLQTSAAATAAKLLRESARLAADALREVKEAIAEAKGEGSGGGFGMMDDDEEEDGEDDDEELLADASISGPLEKLVSSAHELLLCTTDEGLKAPGASNATLSMLITCGQAASTCLDSTVACAHEDDVKGLAAHAASLHKVLTKLHGILSQRCGMEQHERRLRLAAAFEVALAELTAACKKVETGGATAEAVGAMAIS